MIEHFFSSLSSKKQKIALFSGAAVFLTLLLLAFGPVDFFPLPSKDIHKKDTPNVLAETSKFNSLVGEITFNIPAIFNGRTTFNENVRINNKNLDLGTGSISASNILYSLRPGANISITGDRQNPTISASISGNFVTTLQGQSGAVALVPGTGITIDGLTITNDDPGSAQNIFKTISVEGTSITASSNTDILELAAGTGISLATDGKTVTITNSAPASGSTGDTSIAVTQDGTSVVTALTTLDFAGSDFTVTQSPTGEANITTILGSSINLASSEVTGVLPVANGGTGATTLADLIALGTDTTGNYISTITGGSGLSVSGSGSETAAVTVTLGPLTSNWDQTGAFDIILNNASSELQILESTGGTFYGTIDVGNLSANRTYTFPDGAGTVCILELGNCGGGGGGNISGSGTSGQITFFNGTNTITSETTGFSWDTTNKKLGLGTDTPGGKLDVTGSSTGQALAIFNETGNQNIIAASASGTTRLVLDRTGNLNIIGGAYQIGGTTVLSSTTLGTGIINSSLTSVGALSSGSITTGFGTIATNNTITGTTLNGTTGLNTGAGAGTQRVDSSGNLLNIGTIDSTYLDTSTNTVNLAASTALQFNGTTVIDASRNLNNIAGLSTSLNPTAANTYNLGTGTGNQFNTIYGNSIFQNGNQVCDTSGNCSALTVTYWDQLNGALRPKNSTVDLLVGGQATESAKFAVLNVNSGTPTASLSAGVTGGLYLSANGTLQTTANQALTIGGNTTGDITLSPRNGSGTVTSTGTVNLISGKTYQINGTDVLSGTTLGSGVINSSLTSVGVLNGGSITSGFGTIDTGDTITGTTINGTTGINTGAGAGTQRIDNSGNLVNIGTITASGLISANAGLTVANGQNLTLAGLTTNNNSVLYTNGSGTVIAATTTGSGQCLLSNGSGAAPSWGACPGSSTANYWQLNNGALSPFSETLDVLVGNTASSAAEFAIRGIAAGTNPTASVSATAGGNAGNGIVIAGDGSIQSFRNNTLTLGGNTTGNITLNPLGGSGTVLSTGDLNLASGKAFQINGTSVLNSTTLGNSVINSSLTSVGTLTSGTWNATAIGAQYGGTGINTAAATGVPTISSGTWSVSSALAASLGGTGDDTSGTTGVPYISSGNWQYEAQLSAARGGTGVNGSSASNGQLLIGNGSGFSLANITAGSGINISNGSGSITIAQDAASSSKWTQGAGFLTPNNNTLDMLIGGNSTASAKFGLLNVNSGTPTASISGSNGATYLTANGLLQATNNQTLTIGGNTTGNIILSPQNGSGTVMSTGIMNLATGKTYQINGTDVLSGTTLGSGIINSSLTSVGALNGGSITSGFGTIDTGDTITGTTLNGTTGINTGAGAGTQRIDASGNLVNIGTIDSTYLDTSTNTVNLAASTALQFNGTTVIDASRNLNNIAGLSTSLNPTAANTYNLGTGTGNQFNTVYSNTLYQNGNQVCDTSGNCAGGAGGSKWQVNSGVLAPLTPSNLLVLGGNTSTVFQMEVNGKVTGKSLVSLNETGDQNILTASASGTTVFNLNRNGNLQFTGNSGFLNTLTSAAGAARTYTLPDGTGTICLVELGNCAGSGGGITGSGTAGQIAFFSGSGSITSETSGFAWDATNNKLGIGIDSPAGKFQVTGASTGQALAILNETGDQNILAASASGTTVSTLDRSGNLALAGQLSNLTGSTLTVNDNLNLVTGNAFQINGTNVLSSNTLGSGVTASSLTSVGTLTSGVWNATVIGAQYGGTGLNTSAQTGVPTISSGTWSVSSALAASLGGTGDDTSGTTGVPYISGGNWQYEAQLSAARGGTGVNGSSASNGQLLIGNGSGFSLANITAGSGISITNGSGSITISQNGAGSSKWIQNDSQGTLTPNLSTLDTLFGGTSTASAKFGILNMAGGTPTASLSAGTNSGLSINASGNIQTFAGQSLTLGGNTTGNIILDSGNNVIRLADLTTNGVVYTSGSNGTLNSEAQLAVSRGGTGASSVGGSGAIAYSNGSAYAFSNAGTTGQALVSGGTGAPTWTTGTLTLAGNFATSGTSALTLTTTGATNVTLPTTGTLATLAGSEALTNKTVNGLSLTSNADGFSVAGGTSSRTLTVTGSDITLTGGGNTLTLTGNASLNQNLLTSSSPSFSGLTVSGLNTNNNSVLYTNGSGTVLAATTTGTGECLRSNGTGAAPTWSTCPGASATNYWQLNGGAISPFSETLDLLVGNTASSAAEFAVRGIAAGTNPTASVSATTGGNSGNGIVIAGDGSLQSLRNNTLTIGGNTTGNITLSPLGGNGTVTSTGNLNLASGKAFQINGASILDSTTLGSSVINSSLTSVGTLTSGTWNATAIGAQYGGTGDDTSGTTGVPYISGGNWQYEAQLSAARGGTGVNGSSASNGQLLIGNGSGFSLANITAGSGINISNGSGSITISQTGGGSSKWTQNDSLGTLTPNVSTLDVLLGGTATTSAKFAVTNMAGGTPTASLSAGTNSGLSLNASGNLQTFAGQSLTLGGTQTGNIILDSGNGIIRLADLTTNGVVYTSGSNGTLNSEAQLATARGGLGANVTAAGAGEILYSTSATTYDSLAAGTAGQALVSGGAGSPTWTTGTLTLAGNFATAGTSALTLTTTGATNVTLPTTGTLATLAGSEALTNKTINGLSLTSNADGFSVAGGTSSRTLTVTGSDITLTGGGNTLTLTGNASLNQNLLTTSSPTFNALTLSSLNSNNNSVLYTNASGAVNAATTTTSGLCLMSNTNTPAWATCPGASATNYWQLGSGVIAPFSNTLDLLVGGTTSSSAVFKVSPNGSSPTASVAANTTAAGLSVDNRGAGNLFTAGKAGKTHFVIDNNGNTNIWNRNRLNFYSDSGSTLQGYVGHESSSGDLALISKNANSWLRLGSTGLGGIAFWTDGNADVNTSPQMFFNSSGQLSLGTISSLATLDVRAASGTQPVASLSGKTATAGLVVDNSGVGDILTASSSGLNRFVVKQNGNVGIGTNNPAALLDVAGTINASGLISANAGLTVANGQNLTLAGLTSNNNSVLYTNGSGVINAATTASSGLCLMSNANTPAWATCPGASATNYWQLTSGALSPFSDTTDLLVGNTATTAAEFSVLGIAAGTNPTASVSATSGANNGNGIVIAGDGSLQSLRNNTLTIGGSTTGNISLTENTLLSGNFTQSGSTTFTTGTGQVTLAGNVDATSGLDVTGASLTVGGSAASITTAGVISGSQLVIDNTRIDGNTLDTTSGDLTIDPNGGNVLFADGDVLNVGGATAQAYNFFAGSTAGSSIADGDSDLYIEDEFEVDGAVRFDSSSITFGNAAFANCNTLGTSSGAITCGTANLTNYWQLNSGALSPFSNTLDLLVGGTSSSSAVFKVSPSGTSPIASIAANSSYAGLLVDNRGSGDLFAASSSGLNRFVIKQNGNIGIGNNLPDEELTVGSSGSTTDQFIHVMGQKKAGLILEADTDNSTEADTAYIKFLQDGGVSSAILGQNGSAGFDPEGTAVTGLLSNAYYWGTKSTDELQFGTNNILRMTLDTDGKLGIGTNDPLATLDVRGRSGTLPVASISGQTARAAMIVDNSGLGDLFTASSSGLNRFVIKQNGNVGIGTANPSTMLDIAGSITASGDLAVNGGDITSTGALALTPTTTLTLNSTGDMTLDSSADIILDADGADIRFRDAGTAYATWTNSSTDLTLDVNGGNFLLADGDTLNAGGAAGTAYNFFAGSTTGNTTAANDNDLYIEDILEVDGNVRFDSATITLGNAAFTTCGTLGTSSGALTCGGATPANYWQLGSGVISPFSNTLDLLVGGTSSSSAKFKVSPSGTSPTASIAANTSSVGLLVDNTGAGDLFTASKSGKTHFVIANNGSANIWNRNKLNFYQDNGATLQGFVGHEPSSGDMALISKNANSWLRLGSTGTGGIAFWTDGNADVNTSPQMFLNSAGRLGLGTINALATLDIRGNSNSMPAASVSGSMAKAAFVVDNSSGDLFTASSSGLTRFTIGQTGTISSFSDGSENIFDTNVRNTSGLRNGYHLRTNVLPGSASSASFFGTYNDLYYPSSSAVNLTGDLTGSLNQVTFEGTGNSSGGRIIGSLGKILKNSGSGTVATAISSLAEATFNGGTVTNSYGMYVKNPDGSGTVTNAYGMYIENITKGTNNTSLHVAGGKSYFGGDVGVGIASTEGFQVGSLAINESPSGTDSIRMGVNSGTARIMLEDNSDVWEIDNDQGNFRIFKFLDPAFTMNSSNAVYTRSVAIGPSGVSPLGTFDVRARSGTLAVATVSGSTSFAGMVVDNSGTGDIFTASSGGTTRFTIKQSGVVEIGNNTNGLTFDYLNGGPNYRGLARPSKQIVLSPEFPGAVLTASGSSTTNGLMTSDASPSATPTTFNFQTYYDWSSSQTSLQDYNVAIRITLPADFSSWAPGGAAMQIKFNTELASANDNRLDAVLYKTSNSAQIAYRQAQVSTNQKTWKTIDISANDLNDGSGWNTASDSAMLYLKMSSKNNNYVQVGDIILNYLSRF